MNLLAESTEGVAEGFGCQVEQRLQEHVDLQRVEALALVWKKRKECKDFLSSEEELLQSAEENIKTASGKKETHHHHLLGWGWALL